MIKRYVWKFSLTNPTTVGQALDEPDATFHIEMPEKAEILSVGVQDNNIVLWAFVTPDWPLTKRVIEIYRTGQLIEVVGHPYLGTVQTSRDSVCHVLHVFDGGEA